MLMKVLVQTMRTNRDADDGAGAKNDDQRRSHKKLGGIQLQDGDDIVARMVNDKRKRKQSKRRRHRRASEE